MLFKINLKSFSIKNIKAENLYLKKNFIVGAEGTYWIKNKYNVSSKIILNFYKKAKEELTDILEGNFLIFIIDLKNKTLEIYTDIVASLPLYYTINNKYLTCSNNLKQILKENLEIDKKSVFLFYKLGYIPAPYTIFKGIRKIKPGYSIITYKNLTFINRGYELHNNYSLLECIKKVKENIKNYCKNKLIGILTTGGLDSSLLVYLTKELNPYLYFAAIIDKSIKRYNEYSIEKCKLLAKIFNLKFKIIPIKKEDYLRAYFKVVKLMDEPINDIDLPAVYILFKEIRKIKESKGILSGMGIDELFDLPKIELKKYLQRKIPIEINIHKKLAHFFNLDFYAPYLNKDLINYSFNTSLKKRKNKKQFKKIVKLMKALPHEYIDQPSLHSTIPKDFLNAVYKIYSKILTPEVKENYLNIFNTYPLKTTILKLWLLYCSPIS